MWSMAMAGVSGLGSVRVGAMAAIAMLGCNAVADPFSVPERATERLLFDGTQATAESFARAYFSQELIQSYLAEAFLIGILDVTEGGAWCDYRDIVGLRPLG